METGNIINELLEKYLKNLKVRRFAKRTIKTHLAFLHDFFTYLKKEHDITGVDQVTKEAIYQYQIYQYERLNSKGRPNAVGTQNNALKPVKTFFKFLREYDYIVSDPAASIQYAKEPKRLPCSILTRSEVRKILHAPDLKNTIGYRDRTILEVLYSSGIRSSELNNLKLADADCHDGYLRIDQGKGKKDRIVPIGKIACRYLENYIKSVRSELVRDPYNNYLFLSFTGNKFSRMVPWYIVDKYVREAKIKKRVSPHTFRHTCATAMLRNKADIRSIQELLGHSSVNSTQIYTRVSIADLKEVHKQCHPREKDKE